MRNRPQLLSILIVLVLGSPAVWGDAKADAQANSRNVLEVYLDKAEGAETQDAWKATSDGGLLAAQAAWERVAMAWNEDPQALDSDRKAEADYLSELVTKAWQKWLVDRFYQKVGSVDAVGLGQAVTQADQNWLYVKNAQGTVEYDAAGNPKVVTKSANDPEDTNDTGWKAALAGTQTVLLASWDQKVQAALPELYATARGTDQAILGELASQVGALYKERYKQELDTLYQQQVARFAATRLYDQFSLKKKANDATAGALVDQLIADVKTGTNAGIETIKAGLGLTSTTVGADSDVNSASWEASFKQVLNSGLAKWDIAEKQLLADRADWESRAGASYQAGEVTWATAYNKLVQERSAWQSQLKAILDAGQAQWDGKQTELSKAISSASAQLDQQIAQETKSKEQQVAGLVDVYAQAQNLVQTAQSSGEYWFNRMADPLNHGTSLVYSWKDMNAWAGARLDTLVATVQSQIVSETNRLASLNDLLPRVDAYLSHLNDSVSDSDPDTYGGALVYVTHVERRGGDENDTQVTVVDDWNFYWPGPPVTLTKDPQVLGNLRNSAVANIAAMKDRKAKIESVKGNLGQSSLSDDNKALLLSTEQLYGDSSHQESWISYNEGAHWLLQRENFQAQADEAKTELTEGLKTVIGSGGDVQSVLSANADLESGYLGEYQVALLKAKVQKAYWDREYSIAKQVYDYATDTSSGRPTEAKEQELWNAALADYDTKKGLYAGAMEALSNDGTAVSARQSAVEAAESALELAKAALQAAQSAYTVAVSAKASEGNVDFYSQQIGSFEKNLEDLFGLRSSSKTPSMATQLAAYRAALRDEGYGQELVGVQKQLASLVQGTTVTSDDKVTSSTPSLAALQQLVAGLFSDPAKALAKDGSVPATDQAYGTQAREAQATWQSTTGDQKALAAAQFAAYYAAYSEEQRNLLLQRQAQISLLLAGTTAEWYTAQTGKTPTGTVSDALVSDRLAADGALLAARLGLAQEAWGAVATGKVASTANGNTLAALIVAQKKPTNTQAAAWREALTGLLDAGNSRGWWSNLGAHRAEMATAIASITDPTLRGQLKAFMAGASGLTMLSEVSGRDATTLLSATEYANSDRAATLVGVYDQTSASSLGNLTNREAQAQAALGVLLNDVGWAPQYAGGNFSVAGASILQSLYSWRENSTLETRVSDIVVGLRSLEPDLRSDIRDATETLANSLVQQAALMAQAAQQGSTEASGLNGSMAEAQRTVATLTQMVAASEGQGTTTAESLQRLVSLRNWAQNQASTLVPGSLKASLDSTLTQVLASLLVQARIGAAGDDADAWAAAQRSVDGSFGLPPALEADALAQAKALLGQIQSSSLGTLTELASDPTSAALGTVKVAVDKLDLARGVWAWVHETQAQKIADYRAGFSDPAQKSLVDHVFQARDNGISSSTSSTLEAVMGSLGAQTAAGTSAWAWFQDASVGLGGALVSSSGNTAAYQAQQTKVNNYLATIVDASQKTWVTLVFQALQNETDRGKVDLQAVLADAFGSTPHGVVADAWTLAQTPNGVLDGSVVASTAPEGPAAQKILMAAYEAGMGDSRSSVTQLLEKLGAAVDARNADLSGTLVEFLVSGGSQALVRAREAGTLAELRERALAVSLASQVSNADQFNFLTSLLGEKTYGTIEDSTYGSGQAFEATYTGFAATNQALTDTVVGWYLKDQTARGYGISSSVLARLSNTAQAKVSAFAGVQNLADGYVPGLGEAVTSYAATVATGTELQNHVVGAVNQGSWEDEYYLSKAGASGGSTPGSVAAQVVLWRLGNLDLELPQLKNGLTQALMSAQKNQQTLAVQVEFRRAVQGWQSQVDNGDTGYRQFLTGMKDTSSQNITGKLGPSAEAGPESNLIAQGNDDLGLSVDALNKASEEVGSTAVVSAFRSQYAKYATAGATPGWTDADTYHIADQVQTTYAVAVQNLGQSRAQVANAEAQILKLGKIRQLVAQPPSDAVTDALRAKIETTKTQYLTLQSTLSGAMDALAEAMTQYNTDYQASNVAYQTAEDARFDFEAQDQVLTYAKNGYLTVDDSTLALTGYQSPSQLLASATTMQTRANNVYAALTNLNPSTQNATDGVSTADSAYQTTTNEELTLNSLQDQLAAQIARQDAITQSYGKDYDQSVNTILHRNPALLTDGNNLWTKYIIVDPTKGLSVGIDPDTFVLSAQTPAQKEAMAAFVKDTTLYDEFKPGTYDANAEGWLASMSAWSASNPGSYTATLKNWGLALDYMMTQVNSQNAGSATSELITAGGAGAFIKGNDELDAFLVPNGDLRSDIEGKSNNNNYTYLASYRDYIKTQMRQAYEAVRGDQAHWQLFQNAVAMKLTGTLADDGYFRQSAIEKAHQYIRDEAQREADSHNATSSALAVVAGGFAAAASAAWAIAWMGGASIPFATWATAQALIFGGISASEHFAGVNQQNAADKASALVRGADANMLQSFQTTNLETEAVRWTNYSQSWKVLQTLKGTLPEGTLVTAGDVELSLSTALGQRNTSLGGDQKSIVEKYFVQLTDADKKDSITALAAIVRLAEAHQKNADQDLQARFAALQTQFLADEAKYKTLEAQYLAGDTSVTLDQLKAQGVKTYQSPVYTALVQARTQMAEDSFAVAPATTGLNGYETRKTTLVNRIAGTIDQLEAVRLAHLKDVRLNEWNLKQTELNQQESRWQNQINATVVKSQQAWSDSFGKLNSSYQNWQANFAREYQNKAQTWSAVYQNFQSNRRQWVDTVATNADQAQNQVWAIAAGQAAEASISRSALTLVGDMAAGILTTDTVLDQVLAGNQLASYLAGAQSINSSLSAVSTNLRTGMKYNVNTVNALAAIKTIQNQSTEDLTQHAALIVAAQARDNLAATQQAYKDQVVDANQSFEKQMDETFQSGGFGKEGGQYHRRSIIGSTLAGSLYEEQSVDTYKPFATPGFDVKTTLDDASLAGLDASAVQARVDTAMGELKADAEAVFGPSDKDNTSGDFVYAFKINGGDGTDVSTAKAGINWVSDSDGKSRTAVKTIKAGTFNKHLGYTPELKTNADLDNQDLTAGYNASILVAGEGEEGRLIGWYQYFSMRASKGWAQQDQPFYSQKLYDDRGSFIKAPTLKDVAMTGVGIAAALATGGTATGLLPALIAAGETAGMTIGADALFTAADVAHGMDAGSAWGSFGKRALTTGVTSALTLGMGSNGLNVGQYFSGLGSVGQSMATAGLNSTVNRLASTSISSLNWQNGHIGFDTDSFGKAWDVNNVANYSGVLTSMAGSLGNSLGASVGGDLAKATGWNTKLTGALGNLAGMAAGQAIGYGASMVATTLADGGFNGSSWAQALDTMGGVNVNLASAGMLLDMAGGAITMGSGNTYSAENLKGLYDVAGKLSGTGLFEMSLTSGGVSGTLGQGGVNLGEGLWNAAKYGYGQANIEAQAKTMSQPDAKQRLTDLYSYGDYAAEGLVNRLGAKVDRIAYADQGPGGQAVTTTTDTGRLITLDSEYAQSLGATGTVTLSHEAWRNGRDDGVVGQAQETNDAVMAHISMAMTMAQKYGAGQLTGQAAEEVAAINSHDTAKLMSLVSNYDGSGDYWKVKKDGSIAYDGQANLYDENGKMIRETKSQGIEGSMLELMGLSDTKSNRAKVQEMMKASGMQMDVNGNWLGGDTSVVQRAQFGGEAAYYTANHVNLTEANMGKTISLNQIKDVFASVGADKSTYQNFIEKNYGSAMGYLAYVGNQTDPKAAQSLYSGAYTEAERGRIQANISFLQSVQKNGINYGSVVPGVSQTTGFEDDVSVNLVSSSVEGAASFSEKHTGFDYGSGGTSVNTPGGIWQVTKTTSDKVFMQLFGTDVKMRVQHLNPAEVANITLGKLIGEANGSAKIINYPTASFGSGNGPHVHIDFTRNLPGANSYQRMFVNPSNWNQGNQLNYSYTYYDANKLALPGYPKNFNRY